VCVCVCVCACVTVGVTVKVPRLFVDGRYIGTEPEIQRLHDSGELANILRDAGALPASAAEIQHQPSSASLCDASLTSIQSSNTNTASQLNDASYGT